MQATTSSISACSISGEPKIRKGSSSDPRCWGIQGGSGDRSGLMGRGLLNRRFQLGHDLEEVADQTVDGDLEDRRVRVLVDRDDGAGILDAGEVLDGAGDADRHVQ